MTHRPFDDHTLRLLNAAVWYCETRDADAIGQAQVQGWRLSEVFDDMKRAHRSLLDHEQDSREIQAKANGAVL